MRLRPAAITCITLTLLLGQEASAQRRGGGTGNLSTFRSSRYHGTDSRAAAVRRMSPLYEGQGTSMLDQPRPSIVRARRLLDARNLLTARSILGRNVTPYVGRSTLLDRDLDRLGPKVSIFDIQSRPATTTQAEQPPLQLEPSSLQTEPRTSETGQTFPRSYEDALESRLDKVAQQRFNLGAAYARAGDYLRAEQAFDIAKQVWADDPKPYLASMYVAMRQRNTNTAIGQMILAIDRAKTLDDMKIDHFIETFYAGESAKAQQEAFRSTLEAFNMASAVGGDSPLNLLLAYFSWVDGDIDAAVRAAESAVGAFGTDKEERIGKFRDLLTAEKQAMQSPNKERKEPAKGEGGDPIGS